jgi:hypothetical protein
MVMLNSEQTEAPHRVLRDREGVLRAEKMERGPLPMSVMAL